MENKNKILVNDKMPRKKKQVINSSAILREIEEAKKKENLLEKGSTKTGVKGGDTPLTIKLPNKFKFFPTFDIEVKTKGKTWRPKKQTIFVPPYKSSQLNRGKAKADIYAGKYIQKLLQDSPNVSVKKIGLTKYNQQNLEDIKKVDRSKMKIKLAGSMNLDGIIDNELWNKNPNLCVPDWLMYQYGKRKGYIKKVKTKEIIEQSSITDVGLDPEPNKNGYTLDHIICFCANNNISLYALYNNEIIHAVQVKKCEYPLVIEIKNNHLYPIIDTNKKQSIIRRSVKSDNIIQKINPKEKEITLEKHFQPKEEYNELDYIISVMKERNSQPYPLDIIKKDSGILPFKLGEEYIIPRHYCELMEEFCELNELSYNGEIPTTFLGTYLQDFPKSFMNQDVYDALTTRNVKNRTHLGFYGDNTECCLKQDHEYECYDINKCYRYCMENPMDDFMTIQFQHEPISCCEFNPELFGLWFVETDNITLLHKNNWYSTFMLDYASKQGILFKPIYYIKGRREGKELVKDVIDTISLRFEGLDEKFQPIMKEMVNCISGTFGKHHQTTTFMKVDNNKEEALSYLSKQEDNEVVFYQNDGIYLFGKKENTQLLSNNIPMYIQILDQSNIMLYELTREVGGFENLVYRKTDFVMMKKNNAVVSPTDEVGGYKCDDVPKQYINKEYVDVNYKYEVFGYDVVKGIKNSNEYPKVIKHLKKHSLMINAPAGTGKSFIIHKVVEAFGEDKCIKLAPTNIASRNIGGQTIHSFFQMGTDLIAKYNEIKKKIVGKELIIIDEISMITGGIWSILYQLKRNCKNLRFLLVGDDAQLPPIEEMIYDYFNHASIKYICDYFTANLKLCRNSRYNKEMFKYLSYVRQGTIMDEPIKKGKVEDFIEARNICFTNKKRKEINKMVNKYYTRDREHMFIAFDGVENPYNQDTYIYEGLELMSMKTENKLQLTKNETYTITHFNEECITILNNDEDECCIPHHLFHTNFMLCYCITTHRSQGLTLKGRVNIHEYNKIKFNVKMCYTAMSRATNLDNLHYY